MTLCQVRVPLIRLTLVSATSWDSSLKLLSSPRSQPRKRGLPFSHNAHFNSYSRPCFYDKGLLPNDNPTALLWFLTWRHANPLTRVSGELVPWCRQKTIEGVDALLTAAATLSEELPAPEPHGDSAVHAARQDEQHQAAGGSHEQSLAPETYYNTLQALSGMHSPSKRSAASRI